MSDLTPPQPESTSKSPIPTTSDHPNPTDSNPTSANQMIDPALADLPAPPHHNPSTSTPALASTNGNDPSTGNGEAGGDGSGGGPVTGMSITESIASAPNPRPADFSMLPLTTEDIDLSLLDDEPQGSHGSPSFELLRAIAPPNASQPDINWPAPPPNASVNLFIGRALLSNGNDNWPLKPNDIVNWIRKHYPSEWDGDEGRCSAHRVRTYLARKGADMYYEKLNQGCIAGWRIRQNHLWRFENGGFLGRGMKQEEAIAQAAKESEAIATASFKAAAAEALATGHPNVKVSMSQPGINDGLPLPKRQRIKGNGQARRRNTVKMKTDDTVNPVPSSSDISDVNLAQAVSTDTAFYRPSRAHDTYNPQSSYDPNNHAGPSTDPNLGHSDNNQIDPTLMSATSGDTQVDMDIMQRAMQAAAANVGQMDELEMGMQLPIEMQLHDHDEGGNHPYTPHGEEFGGQYGFTGGQGQVYGNYQEQ